MTTAGSDLRGERDPEVLEIELRWPSRTFLWGSGLFALVLCIDGLWLPSLHPSDDPERVRLLLLATSALIAGTGIIALGWLIQRPRRVRPILRLEPEHVVVPRLDLRGYRTIPYGEIRSFGTRSTRRRRSVAITTRSRLCVHNLAESAPPDALPRLQAAVQERVEAQPGGREHWAILAAREANQRIAISRRPVVSFVICFLLAAVFAVELAVGAVGRRSPLIELGAIVPVLLLDGQWFRVVAATFLHFDWLHFAANAIGLLGSGFLVEGIVGRRRFLIVYMVSSLAGMLIWVAWMLFRGQEFGASVGASCGIYGLLGCSVVLGWRFRRRLAIGVLLPLSLWVLLVSGEVTSSLVLSGVSVVGHLGGFLGGALATLLLYAGTKEIDLHAGPSRLVTACVAALALLFVAGAGEAWVHASDRSDRGALRVAEIALREPVRPELLSSLAWSEVEEPGASPRLLEAARAMAARAVESDPENAAFLDTLAMVHFRLGDVDAAIATERRAAAGSSARIYAMRLARFLHAGKPPGEAIRIGTVDGSAVRIVIDPVPQADGVVRAMHFDVDAELPHGVVVYAFAMRGAERLGLFGATIGAGRELPIRMTDSANPSLSYLPEGATFELALIDSTGADCEAGTHSWFYWSLGRSFAALP